MTRRWTDEVAIARADGGGIFGEIDEVRCVRGGAGYDLRCGEKKRVVFWKRCRQTRSGARGVEGSCQDELISSPMVAGDGSSFHEETSNLFLSLPVVPALIFKD